MSPKTRKTPEIIWPEILKSEVRLTKAADVKGIKPYDANTLVEWPILGLSCDAGVTDLPTEHLARLWRTVLNSTREEYQDDKELIVDRLTSHFRQLLAHLQHKGFCALTKSYPEIATAWFLDAVVLQPYYRDEEDNIVIDAIPDFDDDDFDEDEDEDEDDEDPGRP